MKYLTPMVLAIASILAHCASVQPANAAPIPAEKQFSVSLNGTWRFKLEQAPPPPRVLGVGGHPIPIEYPVVPEPFYKSSYQENADWHDLAVPGNWEIAGYSPATYNQPDNASGLYRMKFDVPAEWKGRLVKINFDGVQNGCEVWCNGEPVLVNESSGGKTNYHESGWTAWQADLSPVVKFRESNLLALRVTKNTKTVDCDTGDFFFLGGVYRPVTLFSVPENYLEDVTLRTKLLPGDKAEVTAIIRLSHASQGGKVAMNIEGQPTVESAVESDGQATLTQVMLHPKLWSAEFPDLYKTSIELRDSKGAAVEKVERRVGIREVTIQKGIFCVNSVPVKLVGICRHDVSPTDGSAVGPELWKKDLTLMKACNFNAVRTSHYPYGSGFYDLCDEMGFYVLDEEPFCWVDCSDTTLTTGFEQRAREAVQRDKNHACVVIWGIGNENKPGINNTRAAQITREIDPTRPRLISCQRSEDGGANVEFDDAHYVTPQQIHKAENDPRRANWPMIYTENPNVWEVRNGPDYGSLDLWAQVIVRTWRELWKDEHIAGNFLWEWQDRAVADKSPTKYYYYFPETGINLVKVKGVVDGFRNPRPEYFHIKMAQSPVAVNEQCELTSDGVSLQISNRYSFTPLEHLDMNWSLIANARPPASGTAQLKIQPRSQGQVHLPLPAAKLAAADTLVVQFEHPGGWNVATYQFHLKPVSHEAPKVESADRALFPQFNLVTAVKVPDGKGWQKMNRSTGQLTNILIQRKGEQPKSVETTALLNMLRDEVQTMDADVVLSQTATPSAHVHVELSNATMNYKVLWTGTKTDISELGWIFHAANGMDHFSWDRKAFWSWYPPDHIGRSSGTATPDSARVELTKVDRPDAFDFNSTKFDCNWATLTDSNHRGLSVNFPPDQRQHVRGGFDADGNCTLVVNRCYSPPPDLSSKIVSDLYTTLKKDDQVTGTFRIEEAN